MWENCMIVTPELILQEQNLVPCHVCGRTFLPNPLKKHEKVCEKNALKKRKPFDSLKQRVEGTELAAFHQKSYLKKTVEPQEQKRSRSSKWKEKHLELVTAIRAAKGIPNEMQSRSPKAKNTTLTERCPSCDRHFGPKAYDRHVEWCTERKARIQQSPASVQKAKEMLEARIKYRVPPLNKSKRARVREKYSTTPNDSETASVKSVGSNLSLLSTSFSRGPSVRKPKSLVNVSKVNDQKNVEKLDLERGSGDKVKQEHVKCVLPDIGTPGTKTELANSAFANGAFIKGNLTGKKISSVIVNDQICDMIMSPKMVTWKDTTQNNSEEFVPQTKRTYFQMHKRKTVYLSSNSVKSVQNIAKDVVECAIDNSKPQVEKILSSSDILHKSKIPTNWAFKKVTEVLRKYKKRTPKLKDVNSKDTKNKEHCSFTDIPESKEVRVRSVEPIEKVSDISFVGRNSESISTDNREFESVYRQILDVRLDLAEVTGCRKGVEFLNADTEVFIPNHSSDVDMAKEIRIGRAEEMHSKEKASFGDGVSDISGLKEVMSCSSGDNRVSPNSRAQINNTEANELLALEGSWKASGKRQNNMLLPLNPLNSVNSLTDETSETSDKAKMQNIMWQPLNPLNIDKRQNNAWKPLNSVKSFTGEGRETSDKDERQHNIWTALNPLNSESSETYPFRCLFEKTLNVSNKRSCSDVALNKSSKNSLVSIYLNKRDGDSESIENVTASGSLPNLSLEYYNIEKFREHRVQKVKTAAHTASDGGENYSVPKKKMRLCSSSTSLTLSFRNESAMSKCSATSAVSPRVRELVGKILKGRSLRSDDNEVILGITLSECEKLIRMSGEQFARVAKRFAKDRVKLPLVVVDGAERSVTKRDEGVQVEIESKGVDFKLPFIGSTRRHKETKDDR
ncbi:uncharacterized protein LOC132698919 isoform X2 [Cylas formicarius]|uniref:uncharacterized protein LOC132698919 isoform X2 n=1 Tax=Cylas formicarius TaxID=197179 RepID=UPI002958344E|nr:uncharacterized protein LOC132698919 isoform X2 [Cylas formicarius]